MKDLGKKKKIIKILIIIMIILCLTCLTLLYLINTKVTNDEVQDELQEVTQDEIETTNQVETEIVETEQVEADDSRILTYTDNRTNYFTVSSIVENYINAATFSLTNQLMDILAQEYIEEYTINKDNVLEKVNINQTDNSKLYIKQTIEAMLEAEQENGIMAYLVKSKYRMSNSTDYTSIQTLVVLDPDKQIYEVYPYQYLIDNGMNNLTVGGKLDLKGITISEDAKEFVKNGKTDKELANELFSEWCEKISYDKQEAYSKLNSNYASSRFNDYSNFQTYLEELGYIPQINQYRVYNGDDYTDYICTDQYNNYYIFRQERWNNEIYGILGFLYN